MRRIGPLVLALTMITVAQLWIPRPVVACRCVAPEVAVDSAGRDPGSSVFTAIAGARVGDSIPVVITRWFKGVPPAGPAIVQGDDPDSLCGPTSPTAGGHYLFVTHTSDSTHMAISGCSVQADLATPDGAALLARATSLFGPGADVAGTEAPSATPQAADPDQSAEALPTIVPIAFAIAFATGLLAGLFVILRRRQPR